MSKKTAQSRVVGRKRRNERTLNVFAVLFAMFPLISVGLFSYNLYNPDPRELSALSKVSAPSTPRLFEEPLITITFDDGWSSVYTDAAPILSEYNIQSTQYILPGTYDYRNYISLAQAKSLKQAGHEIASHTMTHPVLTNINSEQVAYQLEASKASLVNDKLVGNNINFSAPETATNQEVSASIQKYYSSQRNTYADLSNGVNEFDVNTSKSEFDRYEIIGLSVRNTTTKVELTAAIDYARAHNGWLVLVYHQVDSSNTEYAVTPAVFKQHMQLIKDSRFKTSTIGSVLESRRVYND